MQRRRNLLSIASAMMVGLTGCLNTFQASPGGSTPLEVGEDTRAQGERREITSSELQDEFEYIPSNDTIRYPAKRSGGEVIEYAYAPYEHWAESEAQSGAINTAENVYSPPISKRHNLWVERAPQETPRDHRVVYVQKVNDEGTVVEEPSVDLQSVIQDIPTSVKATIEYDGNSDEYTFPFYVYKAESKHVWGTTRPA